MNLKANIKLFPDANEYVKAFIPAIKSHMLQNGYFSYPLGNLNNIKLIKKLITNKSTGWLIATSDF